MKRILLALAAAATLLTTASSSAPAAPPQTLGTLCYCTPSATILPGTGGLTLANLVLGFGDCPRLAPSFCSDPRRKCILRATATETGCAPHTLKIRAICSLSKQKPAGCTGTFQVRLDCAPCATP